MVTVVVSNTWAGVNVDERGDMMHRKKEGVVATVAVVSNA